MGVEDVGLRRPTLDDVFLTLTGRASEDDTSGDGAAGNDPGDGDTTGAGAVAEVAR